MKFSTDFLDEIRARLPVSQVVGARVKLRKTGPRMVRPVAVQRREDAVLHGQRPEGLLSRLFLGQARRHLHLPDGDRGPELPRGGRAARRRWRACRCRRARAKARSASRNAPACTKCWRSPPSIFETTLARAGRRQGARLSRRSAPRRRRRSALSASATRPPERFALRDALAAQGRRVGADDRGGAAGPWRGHRRPLRPVPRPRDVPDPRPRRADRRLRRPRAGRRRQGEISQFAGDRALPQGLAALQPPSRPQGRPRPGRV